MIHNSQLLLEYLPAAESDAGLRAAFPNEPIVLAMTDEANAFNSVDISKCLPALFSYPTLDPLGLDLALGFIFIWTRDRYAGAWFWQVPVHHQALAWYGPDAGLQGGSVAVHVLFNLACLRFLCR